jgi:hypothetical protein
MALTPLLAVALFVLTRQWLFLLLIPVGGAVFRSRHPGHGDHGHPHR